MVSENVHLVVSSSPAPYTLMKKLTTAKLMHCFSSLLRSLLKECLNKTTTY